MKQHNLKCHPEPFQALVDRRKPYEIRRDDRGFEVGDLLILEEWDPEADPEGPIGHPAGYTGRKASAFVTFKTPGSAWGLPADLCVLGVRLLAEGDRPEDALREPWAMEIDRDRRRAFRLADLGLELLREAGREDLAQRLITASRPPKRIGDVVWFVEERPRAMATAICWACGRPRATRLQAEAVLRDPAGRFLEGICYRDGYSTEVWNERAAAQCLGQEPEDLQPPDPRFVRAMEGVQAAADAGAFDRNRDPGGAP